MQLPEPAATWHHKPEPVFLEVAEVSTCPGGAMNHLELADLLIVGLVASRPVSPPLFPLVLGKKILTKRATKRTSLKWCGFHLSSVGVSLFMPKKSLPVHLALCASGSDFTVTRSDSRIQGIMKKKEKHTIWYFSGNLILDGRLQQGLVSGPVCWKRDLGKGVRLLNGEKLL